MISHGSLLLAAAATISAQYANNETFGSCADVHCPSANDDTTVAGCRVTNRTHGMIGLESFSTPITEDNQNLTWTVATHVYDNVDPNNSSVRKISKDFYLGVPPSLDLGSDDLPYQGCAIFLYSNELIRPEGVNASQACSGTVGTECMTSVLSSANYLLASGQNTSESAEEACQRVQRGLNETLASGCERLVGGDSWNGVEAVALTGPNSPQPPSQSANESSTCHPTLPKSNSLTHVFGFNDTGTARSESTIRMFWAVNLVLTMFWTPNGGNDSAEVEGELRVPDSHLSCLWPVNLNDESLESMEPGAAFKVGGSSFLAGVVAMVVVLLQMA